LAIESEIRHIGHNYLPKKQNVKESAPGVNQMKSVMDKVIKVNDSHGCPDVSDTIFVTSHFSKAAAKLSYEKDRQGVDIFNWTHGHKTEKPAAGKRRVNTNPASQNNGNFLYWPTE
jgi:hypothetical protein